MLNKTNNFSLLSDCSVCKKKLKNNDLTVIFERGMKTIFHTTCSNCHTSSIISLSGGQKGLLGVGILTDLDKEEVKKKLLMDAISADEIIEVYKSINKLS